MAPPPQRLAFDKEQFSAVTLKGPLPDVNEIPPLKLRVFENGQEAEVEDPNVFEYPVARIAESKYLLEGKKLATDQDFSGEIFLDKGNGQNPGVAFVQVDLPAGKIKAGDKKFTVRFKEKLPNTNGSAEE